MLALEYAVEAPSCPRCHAATTAEATRCVSCGASLASGVGSAAPPAIDNRAGWLAWGIGAGLGILATLLPIAGWVAWFFASLCHEIGHSAMAMLTGSIAVPAIRLDGHAMAKMSDPLPLVRFAIWAGLGW